MSNFLLGGRIGDLIHSLYVAKNSPGTHDLFITDRRDLHSDGFMYPIRKTINELLPILTPQPWFNSLNEYDNEEPVTNLSLWRQIAYSASWTQMLCNRFGGQPNGDPWITLPKITGWANQVVMHCSVHEPRRGYHWNIAVEKYGPQAVFMGTEEEYHVFGYDIPLHIPGSLFEMFNIINSCKFFIGNQSAPLAIAHSLGKCRLAMLNEVDKLHYVGEERWHKNFYWMDKLFHHFEGLEY